MAEYIERSSILQKQTTMTEYDEGGWASESKVVRVEDIESIPAAADVVEVVHGRWVTDEKGVTYCGRCRIIDDYASVHNYCPNCGARMDGEQK